MKLMIAGPREVVASDVLYIEDTILKFFKNNKVTEVISGRARGVDSIGEHVAKLEGYKFKPFEAKWDLYGKAAGYRRNVEMVEYCDEALIFWNQISKGTKHSLDLLEKSKKPVELHLLP